MKKAAGFTLIEMIVVIGIFAVLLAITIVAINPARQFGQANDTKRGSDVLAILNAIHQYFIEEGDFPVGIPSGTALEISSTDADICNALITEYLAALPVDPNINGGEEIAEASCSSYSTGYEVVRDPISNRITVSAPLTQVETVLISVTR